MAVIECNISFCVSSVFGKCIADKIVISGAMSCSSFRRKEGEK